jgi:hypothetical protein
VVASVLVVALDAVALRFLTNGRGVLEEDEPPEEKDVVVRNRWGGSPFVPIEASTVTRAARYFNGSPRVRSRSVYASPSSPVQLEIPKKTRPMHAPLNRTLEYSSSPMDLPQFLWYEL